ncbi:unnamed protein product [Spirodela intermedia]|uniref:Uncharacterized protein n=1 Tax=Spirodela intermedia TaxID=51605 RepID=A0A7I8IGY7_SPIIN|nr:unnamed protein product [Spirodela intermedia]CAA6656554.1 unnamed protein product [Spirodela intermedia]
MILSLCWSPLAQCQTPLYHHLPHLPHDPPLNDVHLLITLLKIMLCLLLNIFGHLTFPKIKVGEGAAVLQLLAGEDQPLLVRGDALLVLDLGLNVVDRVRRLHLEGPGEGLHEDLHTSPQAEHQVEGGLLLNVVVGEGAAVLQLLAGEDQPLLVRGDALLVLDLGLNVVDRVRRLHLEGDRLPGEGLHEDLHTSPQAEHQVEGGLLLNVVVGEGAAVLQLLAGEDQPLLVRGDALLVLDLGLNVVDRVRRLHLEGEKLVVREQPRSKMDTVRRRSVIVEIRTYNGW